MKILSVNIYYGEGSTGSLLEDIHCRLERDNEISHIVYGRSVNRHEESNRIYKMTSDFWARIYSLVTRVIGFKYNCAYFETYRLLNHIKLINPDIVHLHGLNASYINPYILLKWLGKHDYNVVITHHSDVTITANCGCSLSCELWKSGCINNCETAKEQGRYLFSPNAYFSWKQMKIACSKIKKIYNVGVSTYMADKVKMSPFFRGEECAVIENGVNTTIFHYDANNTNTIIEQLRADGAKIAIHVTPSITSPLKGTKYVLMLARRMPHIKFIIIGGHKKESITIPHPNVIHIPYISSKKELASFYQNADISILTSKAESFSMVTVESLCCGTPVVGFRAGGPETIAIPQYSSFVKYADIGQLQTEINRILCSNFAKKQISDSALKKYDAELMYQKYHKLYQSILNNGNLA